MQPPEYNLVFLETCLEELETYLLQAELFWPVTTPAGVRPPFQRMTIANILLAFNELEAQGDELELVGHSRSAKVSARWEALEVKWQVAIENKAIAEMGARLNLWSAFALDLEEGRGSGTNYAQEVRQRVRIELLRTLLHTTGLPEGLLARLETVDGRIQALTVPAEFVWDPALEPIYPPDRHPFLYRAP